MQITKTELKNFEKNGFLILDDAFSAEELATFEAVMRATIRTLLTKTGKTVPALEEQVTSVEEFDKGIMSLLEIDRTAVGKVYDCIASSPSLLSMASKQKIQDAVNALLRGGETPAMLFMQYARCRIDPPFGNKRDYGWHQEEFYTVPYSKSVQLWAPLIRDTTEDIGTIMVAPGSHKEGIAKARRYETGLDVKQILVVPEVVDKYPQRSVKLKLGQALLFSTLLVHRSGKQTVPKVRFSLNAIYHDVGQPGFVPTAAVFNYPEKTPDDYFDETARANNWL